jgi:predicted RNase H-like nuclease (RuvC/YqgF family)
VNADTIITSLIAGIPAVAAAVFAFRASGRATAVEKDKVDAAAYERSQGIYERALTAAQREVDRLQTQVDRLTAQLTKEEYVANGLRNQLRAVQQRMSVLEHTVWELGQQSGGPDDDQGVNHSNEP